MFGTKLAFFHSFICTEAGITALGDHCWCEKQRELGTAGGHFEDRVHYQGNPVRCFAV